MTEAEEGEGGRESSSERRLVRVAGWERRLWIVVRRRMAVVSLPAVTLEVVHAVRALGGIVRFVVVGKGFTMNRLRGGRG